MYRTIEKKSFGNLTLLLCKIRAIICYCFVHQHGRLITWLQTIYWQNNNCARASPFFVHFCFVKKMPIFTFCGGREHNTTTAFFFFSLPSIKSFRIHATPEKIANIWRIERDGISAIKFEAARLHFLIEVFVAVACRPCCLSFLVLLIMPITHPYSLWNLTNRITTATASKTSLKKWICVLLISIAITPTHFQVQGNSWVEFLWIIFKFRKKKKNSKSGRLFTSSIKREIRHFPVVVSICWQFPSFQFW